jgi:hypothetical protein
MVESIENTELVKMKTAINELQILAASNEPEGPHLIVKGHHRQPNAESYIYEENQIPTP